MLMLEFPHVSKSLATYARRNGKYDRPVLGHMIDLRTEDMGIQAVQKERKLFNIIGKLPDIPQIKQHNLHIVCSFGSSELINDPVEIEKLIKTNRYFVLPENEQSEFWSLTKRPWYDFIEMFDAHDMPVKAALKSITKFTPENTDERIDEFAENRGKIEALSPHTFDKMKAGQLSESYRSKLSRIR